MSTAPDDFDKLDDRAYPVTGFIDLTSKKYPEPAIKGLGRRALVPWSYWGISSWRNKLPLDYYGFRFDDLTQPKASGVVTEDLPFYHLAFHGDENMDKVVKYFTRVVRFSGQESRSDIDEVLVLTTIPSGNDPDEEQPYHSGLLGWLEGIPEGGIITPSVVTAELWWWIHPYVNIRQNDENIIEVDGYAFTHIVSPEQASSKKAYRVQIPPEIIDKITRFGPFGIRMKMRNVMGDEPESRYKYSKIYSLISELGGGKLDQPVVTQGPDEDEVFEVDLDFDAISDFLVKIYPVRWPKPFPSPRHTCQLYAEVTPDDGVTEVLPLGVTPDKNQGVESIFLERNFFNDKVGPGKVRFYYEITSDSGKEIGKSYSNLIYVIGQRKMMPKPLIKPLTGGLIPPDKGVEFGFPIYYPFAVKNLVTAIFRTKGNNNGAYVVSSKQLATTQQNKRLFTSQSLKVLEGKGDLEVLYEVDQGNLKPPRMSEIETAKVGEGKAELPAMYIELVKQNYLNLNMDPNEFTGYGVVSKILWPGTQPGDEVQYSVIGVSPKASFQDGFKVDHLTAGVKLSELDIIIPEHVFLQNNDCTVDIVYSVKNSDSPPVIRHSEVLRFSVGNPLKLESFKLLEADAVNATITPMNVIKGGNLQATYSTPSKGDVLTFKLEGEFGIAQHTEVIPVNPNATVFKSFVPVDVFSRGLRAAGNNFVLKCWLMRGALKYEFDPVRLRLLPIDLPALYIDRFKDVAELPFYQAGNTNIVVPSWLFARAGQFVWVEANYTTINDELITEKLLTARAINASEVTKGISINWSSETTKKIKDGSVIKLTGRVSLPGIPLEQTTTPFGQKIYVARQLPAVLSAPVFQGATALASVTVDPIVFENNVKVLANFTGILASDVITMKCVTQGGALYQMTANGKAGGVVFDFTSQKIIHDCVGGWMQYSYSLLRNGKVTPSNVLTVYVSSIPSAKYPMVTVNRQSNGATIDFNRFSGNTDYSLSRWPLIKTGQRLWITFIGGGRAQEVLSNYPIPASVEASGVVNFGLLRGVLAVLPKNAWFQVEARVTRDGSTDKSRAVVFPISQYFFTDTWNYHYTHFGQSLGAWNRGAGGVSGIIYPRGIYFNTPYATNSGDVISQTLNFSKAYRYRIDAPIWNDTNSGVGVAPYLSVIVGGVTVHAAFAMPHTGPEWYYWSFVFQGPVDGPAVISFYNHQSAGAGRFDNNFYMQYVNITRI